MRGMATQTTTQEEKLLVALQSGVPFDPRPFARIGRSVGLTEDDVLGRVRAMFDAGVARRFGAVFDSRSLGYASTLCAVDIPESALETSAARLVPHPGITHCYQRDGHPNLWFTLTAPADALKDELARVSRCLGSYPVLNLPALRKFKIEAVFGRGKRKPAAAAPESDPALPLPSPVAPLNENERQVVRRLQGSIPVVADPFGAIAQELGRDAASLLALLKQWKKSGVIRRVGLVVRHHQLGFEANSMCVWMVPADRIEPTGRIAGSSPHVTHCYERPASAVFPYNLYAMVHAKTRQEAAEIFAQIAADAGLPPGRMLWSVREFKKSSPIFFCESASAAGDGPS